MGWYHSTCRPEAATLRAIFIAPTKLRVFYIPPFNEVLAKIRGWRAIFIARRNSECFTFHHTSYSAKRN